MVSSYSTRTQRRLKRALTVVTLATWSGPVVLSYLSPPDSEFFATQGRLLFVALLLGQVPLYVTARLFRPPFPYSVTSTMLLGPLGLLAMASAHPEPWSGAVLSRLAVPLRTIVPMLLLGLYAWATGAWGSVLVKTDTMDTASP
jgi:hypothetical protein